MCVCTYMYVCVRGAGVGVWMCCVGIPVLFLEVSFEKTTCRADRRCKGDVQWVKALATKFDNVSSNLVSGGYQETKEQVV